MEEIKNLKPLFVRAYGGISFSPELRAETCVTEFSAELSADLQELGDRAGEYKQKYIARLRVWAERKSRTMSILIAGPSKFPTGSNHKKLLAMDRAWKDFRAWRERYIKRAGSERTKTPEEEIDDALLRLERAKANHDMMIAVNKILRKKIPIEEKKELLKNDLGFTDLMIQNVTSFPHFRLTNNGALIKRLQEKLLNMNARINARDSFRPIEFEGGKITIENDRVNIWHDSKPERAMIETLKGSGFRWAPSVGCWCRKHTANAIRAAKEICGVS